MIKKLHLKSLLLIVALLVGSSSAWADDITYTFNSKAWGATVGDDDANWTSGKDGNQIQNGRGVQVTTGVSGANATSPTSINNISKIVVTYSTNASSGAGTIAFQVGEGEEKSQNVTKTGGTTDRTLTYNFSPAETGKVKMTVNCTTNSIYVKSVTITYSNVAKQANGLAWSATSKAVTYSETPYNLPTLTNPHSLAIEYGSTDESVATIAADGTVTIKNVTGSTTISAYTDGDDTYAAGSVTYTLNVTRKVVIEDGVFNFGFGPSDGGDYDSEMTQGSSIIENQTATWTAGNVTLVVANRYAWNDDGKMVIYKKAGGANAAGSITISCPAGKVITRIELTGSAYSTGTGALSNIAANTGTYTVTTSSAIWTGAAQSVSFTASNSTYINTITVTYSDEFTVQVQSYGWASFIAPAPVQFAANTAYVVTAASVANGLTLAAVTQVPKDTPVLLKGAGDKTVTVIASASAPATNFLSIGDGNDFTSGSYPYVLAKDGTGACFKQWTGSAATLKGRVVLLLDEALSTRSTYELGEEMTGITGVNLNENQNDNRYYDLQGRHVAQPTKGLYIVNGKKIVVK